MEGEAGPVPGLRPHGWWASRLCGEWNGEAGNHGSVSDRTIQAVMVLKYIVPGYHTPTLYFGVANVIANSLIMLRYACSPCLRYMPPFIATLTCTVLSYYGFRRTWRMTTYTIWRYDWN